MGKNTNIKKKSFVFYTRYRKLFERLTAEEVRDVVFAMIEYTETGDQPEYEDRAVAMAWDEIKEQLDFDDAEYRKTCAKRKAAAEARWSKEAENMQKDTNASTSMQDNANNAELELDLEPELDNEHESISDFFLKGISKGDKAEKKEKAETPDEKNREPGEEPFMAPEVDAIFEQFRKMRSEKGRPFTKTSEAVMKDKILKLSRGDPETAVKIIGQAIEGGYVTVISLQQEPVARSGTKKSLPTGAQHDYDFKELKRRAMA